MAFKLPEILKKIMLDTFLIKLAQSKKKIGAIDKTFVSLGNLINKFDFRN